MYLLILCTYAYNILTVCTYATVMYWKVHTYVDRYTGRYIASPVNNKSLC